ncbi:hypothetical protein PR003_g33045 [Phytophthora rubi]|uniref:Uncharacterized protein n=1 Tax=Phytophthora rubi TaxID=129364 RepID=A0A6A4AW30_9STRA|nr:hypothetical protein PR003_g33045 [Phytophthora rubi]
MTKFEMSEGTPSVAPAMTLEHTAFPHLTPLSGKRYTASRRCPESSSSRRC